MKSFLILYNLKWLYFLTILRYLLFKKKLIYYEWIIFYLQNCKKYNFDKSLFARIQNAFQIGSSHDPVQRLKRQYRMNAEICDWPNEYFYGNTLQTDGCTIDSMFPYEPYMVFSLDTDQNTDLSTANEKEADFLVGLLNAMVIKLAVQKYTYGILTPYSKQQELLQSKVSYVCSSIF